MASRLYFSAQSFNGPSSQPGVAFKLINRISRQNIFIKSLIWVKIAPHIAIGFNCRQDSNVIIIFLNPRDSLVQKTTAQFRLTTEIVLPFCIFGAEYIGRRREPGNGWNVCQMEQVLHR